MFKKNRISVCMATYNGEKYIKEQLKSIINQLSSEDEIIISDDGSSDKTISIIKSLNDPRIKIFQNNLDKGPVNNFENALFKASGELIFLSDQDDIWASNKVETILKEFDSNLKLTCIFSNAKIIDGEGKETGMRFFNKKPRLNLLNIVRKNQFLGCTMAFKNNIDILPFSKGLPMHDWYIGLKHIRKGQVHFIDKDLIYYRRHGNNVTTGKRSSIFQVSKWRIQILRAL